MVNLLWFFSLFCVFFSGLFKWQSQCIYSFEMCEVKLGSLNINGAREVVKRAALFNLSKVRKLNVVFLQETHSTVDNEADWKKEWDGEVCLSHKSNNSGGVGILFSKDFIPISLVTEEIVEGRLLKIHAVFENVKLIFINVYAPTVGTERVMFLNILNDVIRNCSDDCYMILGGDFNCTAACVDRNHIEPHGPSKKCLINLIESNSLCDVWRFFLPFPASIYLGSC